MPDDKTIVVEHFRDETGAVRIVIHAAFGGRVNAPWGMALAQRAREALNETDVQVQTTDDGIMLRLPDLGTITPVSALLGMSAAEASAARYGGSWLDVPLWRAIPNECSSCAPASAGQPAPQNAALAATIEVAGSAPDSASVSELSDPGRDVSGRPSGCF